MVDRRQKVYDGADKDRRNGQNLTMFWETMRNPGAQVRTAVTAVEERNALEIQEPKGGHDAEPSTDDDEENADEDSEIEHVDRRIECLAVLGHTYSPKQLIDPHLVVRVGHTLLPERSPAFSGIRPRQVILVGSTSVRRTFVHRPVPAVGPEGVEFRQELGWHVCGGKDVFDGEVINALECKERRRGDGEEIDAK